MNIYMPDNEPFLGREGVLHFDEMLVAVQRSATEIGPLTYSQDIQPWQRVVVDIVPGAVSIAFSIRELVRQGYLYGAATLRRSLLERSVKLQYLRVSEPGIELWLRGWPFKERPTLAQMIEHISDRRMPSVAEYIKESGSKKGFGSQITSQLNEFVHGDPSSILVEEAEDGQGPSVQRFPKQIGDDSLCDHVCYCSVCDLVIIESLARNAFPLVAEDQ